MGDHRTSRRARRGHGRHGRCGGANSPLRLLGNAVAIGLAAGVMLPQVERSWTIATLPADEMKAVERQAYYAGCDQARAAGAAPLARGNPGYRPEMDGDGDGIACEPHR